MTVFNARALASLVTVADSALSKRLTVILTALVKVVETEKDEELLASVDEALRALFSSVSDSEGLNTVMLLLLGWYVSQLLIIFRSTLSRSTTYFFQGQTRLT